MKTEKKEKRVKKTRQEKKKEAPPKRRPKARSEETPIADKAEIREKRREKALQRRSADRKEAQKARLGEKLEVFRRRIDEAPDDRAPVTRRHRGYYPFSKTYPDVLDEAGFRENAPKKKKWYAPLLLVLVFLLVFVVAFVATRHAQLLSAEPPDVLPETTVPQTAGAGRILHFAYEDFKDGDVDAIERRLKAAEADTALFEFKNEEGYLLFSGLPIEGGNADFRVPDADLILEALKSDGYGVGAYISCFKDRVAAYANADLGVQRESEDGRRLWRDNGDSPWLNPFNPDVRTFLLDVVKAAADRFDLIVLDHVCFPTDAGLATPIYDGETDYAGTRGQLLHSFIADAVKAAGKTRTSLLCSVDALSPDADETQPPAYGSLADSAAGLCFADARPSRHGRNVRVGNETFASPASLPYPFVLAVGETAGAYLADGNAAFGLCIDGGDALDDELLAASYTAAERVLIW